MNEEQTRQLAKDPEITVKFAGLLPGGATSSDASDSYEGLFEDLPPGWTLSRKTKVKPRRDNWKHDAWVFAHKELGQEILAVSHETGVEFLMMGLAAPLIANGLQAFVKWSWSRWNERRDGTDKVRSSLVLEAIWDDFPDGRTRKTVRLVTPPPISGRQIEALMACLAKERAHRSRGVRRRDGRRRAGHARS